MKPEEKKIRKLIDVPESVVKKINKKATKENTNFKRYVEALITTEAVKPQPEV